METLSPKIKVEYLIIKKFDFIILKEIQPVLQYTFNYYLNLVLDATLQFRAKANIVTSLDWNMLGSIKVFVSLEEPIDRRIAPGLKQKVRFSRLWIS